MTIQPRIRALATSIRELVGDRTVAVAESCTAGGVAAALAAAGDASNWLRGGLVAYQDDVKWSLLRVTEESVVTREAARQMVRGIADLLDSEIAIATTGVLGDEPVDDVEPATVMIATLVGSEIRSVRHDLPASGETGREAAIERALDQLLEDLRR